MRICLTSMLLGIVLTGTAGAQERQSSTSLVLVPAAVSGVFSAPVTTLVPEAQQTAKPARPPARAARRRGSMVGYIEDASVRSKLRFRFDSGFGNNVPDRAEFFYAKCGCYQLDPPPFQDLDAPGPGPGVPTELDFQQFYAFGEAALSDRFSLFGELPFRAIQPQGFHDFGPEYAPFPNSSGIADIKFGVKGALLASDETGLTIQGRLSAPSGDAAKGLGSNLWSVEPALLYHQNLGDRVGLEAQFGVWLPIGGSDGVDSPDSFSGNVLYYGIGPSFDVVSTDSVQFSPVVELIGWHVLNGFQTACDALGCSFDAKGVNIVNLKVGARTTLADRNSFYVGYGFALTDQVWYDKLFRFEYRYSF